MALWHFKYRPVQSSPAACAKDECAGRHIQLAIETLKTVRGSDTKSMEKQLEALRVLVHLVGDVHQPLHTAENRDGGGNAVVLTNRTCIDFHTHKPVHCKLHSYWDNSLFKAAKGSISDKAFVAELAAMSVSSGGDPESWISESNGLANEGPHLQGFAARSATIRFRSPRHTTAQPFRWSKSNSPRREHDWLRS